MALTEIPVELSSTPGIADSSNATAITIDSSENVGIGTASPGAPLNVTSAYSSGAITTALKLATVGGYNANAGTALDFGSDQGNYSTWLTGRIAAPRTGNNWGGSLVFSTNDNSAATGLAEAMRIDASGDVSVAANATGAARVKGVSGDQDDRNAGGYPQYTFVGNEGTGMRRVAANTLALDAGGEEALRIDGSGHVTMPLQPAFNVYKSSSQTDIAINSAVTITWETEVFDIGSNFASNTFTAPVTGKYQFNANIRLLNLDAAANYIQVFLITSNRSYELFLIDPSGFSTDIDYFTFGGGTLVDMDASDTAYLTIYQSAGTAQMDIGNGTDAHFSGYLVA